MWKLFLILAGVPAESRLGLEVHILELTEELICVCVTWGIGCLEALGLYKKGKESPVYTH